MFNFTNTARRQGNSYYASPCSFATRGGDGLWRVDARGAAIHREKRSSTFACVDMQDGEYVQVVAPVHEVTAKVWQFSSPLVIALAAVAHDYVGYLRCDNLQRGAGEDDETYKLRSLMMFPFVSDGEHIACLGGSDLQAAQHLRNAHLVKVLRQTKSAATAADPTTVSFNLQKAYWPLQAHGEEAFNQGRRNSDGASIPLVFGSVLLKLSRTRREQGSGVFRPPVDTARTKRRAIDLYPAAVEVLTYCTRLHKKHARRAEEDDP